MSNSQLMFMSYMCKLYTVAPQKQGKDKQLLLFCNVSLNLKVGWDLWDQHVITAVNDNTLKVWEAATGNLSIVLTVSSGIVIL